jgi:hypothetical protein
MKNEALAAEAVLPAIQSPLDEISDDGETAVRPESGLGWIPALSVSTAIGLLIVATGFTLSRNNASWAESLFWIGLIVMFAPVAARVLVADASRAERIGLVAVLGMGLYFVKLFHSPLTFTEHDEFLHWRTTNDILQSGHLFHVNPLLPVSAVFPGMETATAALAGVAHLSIFQSGVLVIACARLVIMLCIFLFTEDAGGSSRVAGIAAVIYTANPNFLFFDAMFKYETVALTFAALALFLVARRQRVSGSGRDWLMALAAIMIAAAVISHHLTAYLLTAFLIIWTAAAFFRRRTETGWMDIGALALMALVLNGAWLLFAAQKTVGYVSPILRSAISSVLNLILLRHSVRAPFSSTTGYVFPLWERALGVVSVALLLTGLGIGLWQLWTRRHKVAAIGIALAVSALAYPVSLGFRFTGSAWETANRSSEFIFLAAAFVVAAGIVGTWRRWWPPRQATGSISLCLTLIFLGGIVAGWTPQWRMPAPYLPLVADTRGIDSQTLAAASWARTYLGSHQRFGADDLNELTLGSYGDQNVISGLYGGQSPNLALLSPSLANLKIQHERAGLEFLLVDTRANSARYGPGYILVRPRHGLGVRTQIDADLKKFDTSPLLNRLYDSGKIVIYGFRASGAP